MQLLHERRNETACGVVELNLTMMNKMIGALTTYLIILIQFDASARGNAIGNCISILKNITLE